MTIKQQLIHGNALDYKQIAQYAQTMIVDPPYSKHVHANARSSTVKEGERVRFDRDLGFDHLSDPLLDAIGFAAASVECWSIIYSDLESAHKVREAACDHGATYIRGIPWIRWSMPQLSGDRPPSGCEILSIFYGKRRGRKRYNGPGNLLSFDEQTEGDDLIVMRESKVGGANKSGKHPAEKPLDQMMRLVAWFSQPGDLVIDFCAGKATVGVACSLLGRSYVGTELDAQWHAAGSQRLADAQQRRLSPQDLKRVLSLDPVELMTKDQRKDRAA